jgi:hypothetical protein
MSTQEIANGLGATGDVEVLNNEAGIRSNQYIANAEKKWAWECGWGRRLW